MKNGVKNIQTKGYNGAGTVHKNASINPWYNVNCCYYVVVTPKIFYFY